MSPFTALAEPHRRQILDLLRGGEQPVAQLVRELAVSQPAVSKHLRVLRDAGLVTVRIAAQRRYYRVLPAPLQEIEDWLAPYRALWPDRLDALERELARLDPAGSAPGASTENSDEIAKGERP